MAQVPWKALGGLAGIGIASCVATTGIADITKHMCFDICPITGPSMSPSLSPDYHETGRRDWALWNTYNPTDLKPGDVVLFWHPWTEAMVIKRVIALSGDKVTLDRRRRPEAVSTRSHIDTAAAAERWDSYNGSLQIPHGHIWVEGDNIERTADSNWYGPVSKSLIVGKALQVFRPSKLAFVNEWRAYKSKTKRTKGEDIVPEFWLL